MLLSGRKFYLFINSRRKCFFKLCWRTKRYVHVVHPLLYTKAITRHYAGIQKCNDKEIGLIWFGYQWGYYKQISMVNKFFIVGCVFVVVHCKTTMNMQNLHIMLYRSTFIDVCHIRLIFKILFIKLDST